jgi:hypothetical protein
MGEMPLIALTAKYFERRGYDLEYNVAVEGFSGLIQAFDLLIRKGREEHPVMVKDWKRTVGIDMIIKADKASEDAQLSRPIVVAKKFSDHAKAYSNRKRIILMTEREMLIRL